MATSFTNAWKVNVEENLQDAIRGEFANALPIFRTPNFKYRGNNFLTITGLNSESDNSMYSVIPNSFFLQLDYYYYDRKRNDITVKHFFNQVSRIEEIFYSLSEPSASEYNFSVQGITYEDSDEFNGFRKAIFNIQINNIR